MSGNFKVGDIVRHIPSNEIFEIKLFESPIPNNLEYDFYGLSNTDANAKINRKNVTVLTKDMSKWFINCSSSLHSGPGYRFKIGDVIRYRGPSQGGILAPGDDVEIVRCGADPSYYIVKLAGSFTTHTWMVKDADLEPTYSSSMSFLSLSDDHIAYSDTPVDSAPTSSYDELIEKRKANGECTACGKKREMSMFGLSDCSCSPLPPARW